MKVRDLPASTGPKWLLGGWRMYKMAPLGWSLMAGGYVGIVFLLAMIPIVGQVIGAAVQPVLAAGLFLAAAQAKILSANGQATGAAPSSGNMLFAAFKRPNVRDMVLVGLIESVVVLVILGALFQYILGNVKIEGSLSASDPQQVKLIQDALEGKQWAVFAGVAGIALVKGVLWFCVPLLAFSPSMKASHALRWSVFALLSNPGAMILYGLAMTLAAFVVSIPAAILPPLLVVMVLVATPVVLLSNFVGYRDVFEADVIERTSESA